MAQEEKPASATTVSSDFLIRGSDYLAGKGDFRLVGREQELKNAGTVLMRKDNNNLVLYGPSGVGISAIITGMQASKEDLNTPSDIVGKRFYWLDTDALFSSGDSNKVNDGFRKAMGTLTRAPDTVLVIEDTKDFLEGVKNSGTNNIINVLMREMRNNSNLQVIFEARDQDLADLFKAHSDIRELFTFQEVREPGKEALRDIVASQINCLEGFHGIKISEDALNTVIELTTKYPGLTLNTAQPKRSTVIIEGALTAYRYKAHTRPIELDALEQSLAIVTGLTTTGKVKGKVPAEFEGKSKDELAAMQIEIEGKISAVKEEWESYEKQIRAVYKDQRIGEEEIRKLDDAMEKLKQDEAEAKQKADQALASGAPELASTQQKPVSIKNGFAAQFTKAGMDSAEMKKLRDQREKTEKLVSENTKKYKELTAKMNEGLVLTGEHILGEFSRLSGIPMNKLQQDETQKLLKLEDTLKERVFGQDEPVIAVAKSVRRGRTGLKKPNKPIGSFIFLGPSGVGKTELAKALAATLFGDESALVTYDMSEYQDKSAGAKLIGADPGLVGYEEGGRLTNEMRKRPYCVNVFDEIEKASRDVFDLFLQIVDEGRLTDNRGIPASFGNAINIMTSNVGSKYFLDESLTFEEAKQKALEDLRNPSIGGFRPEFLNRFTGIFCFNRLGQPQIQMIANKSMKELNGWIKDQGLVAVLPEADRDAMCKDKYVPAMGARGILNYIENTVTSDIAETLLRHPNMPGTVSVSYDKQKATVVTSFVPTAANINESAAIPAAKAAAPAPKKKS